MPSLRPAAADPAHPPDERPLLLCDLELGGHHPAYILHLIRHSPSRAAPVLFLVRREFRARHPDVIAAAGAAANVEVNLISPEEEELLNEPARPIIDYYRKWRIILKHARRLNCSELVLLYFDHYQFFVPFAALPCPVSVVYFRPSFHYPSFETRRPTWKERLRAARQRAVMKLVVRRRRIDRVLCLDPLAVEHLNAMLPPEAPKATWLPDPVDTLPAQKEATSSLREKLKIPPDRKILLLFGEISRRKGIYELLNALPLLPDETSRRVSLVLAGPLQEREKVGKIIAEIETTTPILVHRDDRYIPESENRPYFDLADIVLAVYDRHIGMSAILVRAATSNKPVVASNYGIMGQVTREHALGITVETSLPRSIAEGIDEIIKSDLKPDPEKAQRFAARNSPRIFAETVFSTAS